MGIRRERRRRGDALRAAAPGKDNDHLRPYGALTVAGCLWGTGFLFGKIALAELDVPHMILYRLLFACGGFLPVALARGFVHRREDWPTLSMAAAFGVPCVFLVQFEGLARTTVAHASLMVGTSPILLALGATLVGRERVDGRRYALLATSALGALLILMSSDDATRGPRAPTALGDALVFASLLAVVGWVLTSKRLMRHHEPSTVTASVMIVGTAFLTVVVMTIKGLPPVRLTLGTWSALAAQGLLATTAATLLWNWGVSRVPTSQAGVFLNFEPVVGAILGVSVLNERLGWIGVVGGVLIIGAAVAVAKLSAASS